MQIEIKWILTIIVIMTTIAYLNQEVPACVDNPLGSSVPVTNYTTSQIDTINTKVQSDILVFQTSGNSMHGLIEDKQKCVCMKSNTYSLGDNVLFFADLGEGYTGIAHQIIFIKNNTIITKGVNNVFSDNAIRAENILCKVPLVRRYNLYGVK